MVIGRVKAFLAAPFGLRQRVNYLRYRFGRPAERLRYRPPFLSIVTTGRCNLRCTMCHTHSPAIPSDYPYRQTIRDDITLGTFQAVIARFPEAVRVSLIGAGEPLLNPDFLRLVRHGSRVGRMLVSTTTNGVLLEAEAEAIAESGLASVGVSLNGCDAASFFRLTGNDPAIFSRIEAGFRRLVAARDRARSGLEICAQYIVDKENLPLVPAMLAHARGLGADRVSFSTFLPTPYPGFRAEERVPDTAEASRANLAAAHVNALPAAQRARITPPLLLEERRGAPRCRVNFSQLRVDAAGNVGSCSAMLQNMGGQGHFEDADVWNNAFFRRQRRAFLGAGADLEAPCRVCPYNYGVPAW
jgi:MoaA/NifB/PqqE/SkfB family radical SAM enzyme